MKTRLRDKLRKKVVFVGILEQANGIFDSMRCQKEYRN